MPAPTAPGSLLRDALDLPGLQQQPRLIVLGDNGVATAGSSAWRRSRAPCASTRGATRRATDQHRVHRPLHKGPAAGPAGAAMTAAARRPAPPEAPPPPAASRAWAATPAVSPPAPEPGRGCTAPVRSGVTLGTSASGKSSADRQAAFATRLLLVLVRGRSSPMGRRRAAIPSPSRAGHSAKHQTGGRASILRRRRMPSCSAVARPGPRQRPDQ